MAYPFKTETRLTQIALTVRPKDYIADDVLPRVKVGAEKFTYTKADTQATHTIPDTRIGRKSRANQVEFGATNVTDETVDYGLEDPVPLKDIHAARDSQANWDPRAEATVNTAAVLQLAREKRVADTVFAGGNYETGQQKTLSGNSQWSNTASDPIKAILEALDKPLVRPNVMVLGQATWTALRQHARIVEATVMSGAGAGAAGVATRQAVADLFELDAIHIGRTWHSASNRGQAPSMQRLWGKHAALLHLNPTISGAMSATPTWGFTAEWMGMMTQTYTDESMGVGGAEVIKVVDCVKELVSWKSAGYFFQNAVA